jgi:hypothetical protein
MSGPALSDDSPRCELCDWPIDDSAYDTRVYKGAWLYAHSVCVSDVRETTGQTLSEWTRGKADE